MVKKAQPMCIPFPAIFFKLLSVAPSKDLTSLLETVIDHDWLSSMENLEKQLATIPTFWSRGSSKSIRTVCPARVAKGCQHLFGHPIAPLLARPWSEFTRLLTVIVLGKKPNNHRSPYSNKTHTQWKGKFLCCKLPMTKSECLWSG